MMPYDSSNRRRNAALVTLGIILLSEVAGLVTGVGRLLLVQWVTGGRAVLQEVAEVSDFLVGCAAIFQLAALVACAIAFSMWFHRVYRNLPILGATGLALTPARAVGGFYIPFVNLIRPLEAMDEIWLNSQLPAADPLLPPEQPRTVKIWWLSFLAANILANLGATLLRGADDLSRLRWGTVAMLVSDALAIVAAISAMHLVRQISAQQDALHQYLEVRRTSRTPSEAGTA